MLSSEHKYKNTEKCSFFKPTKAYTAIFSHINVRMPTIVNLIVKKFLTVLNVSSLELASIVQPRISEYQTVIQSDRTSLS